jgi:hypothetical protein
MDAHAQLIRALTHGAVYAHPTTEITVLQTHISWVVLTGPYAYKITKPVDLGFVDFSTLAKRHFFCQEELRLNRRLAPHLYLEVVAISGTPEHPRVDGEGTPFEYAVKMHQFAQDRLLSHLLPEGKVQVAHIDYLAQEVSAFHTRIATADPESRFGTPEVIYHPVQENFQHLFDALDDPVRQAHARTLDTWCQRTFIARRADFATRKRDGFVRECHGDLHPGNMDMCGHGVISLTTALIEMGMASPTEPDTVVAFDTPAGVVEGRATVQAQQVVEVSVTNVASFLYARDVELTVSGLGNVTVDVALGGIFSPWSAPKVWGSRSIRPLLLN